MRKVAVIAACLLLLGAYARAQEVEKQIDEVIASMNEAQGEDYLKARAQGVALAPQAREYLAKKAAAGNWNGENWRDALCAALIAGWSEGSAHFSRCYELKGLKPEVYTKRALPAPNVQLELERLGKAAVPAMIEIFLKTLESYPLGTPQPGAGADARSLDAAARARAAERRALQVGIIAALLRIADKRAFRFLAEVLRESRDDEIRVIAASGTAVCGGEDSVPILAKVLSAGKNPEKVRAAAASALGYASGTAALDALKRALSDSSAALRSGAAKGLARMASHRRWQLERKLDRPDVQAMRKAAAAALAQRLGAEGDSGVRREIVQALGRIAHTSVLDALKELANETSDANVKAAALDAAKRISEKAADLSGE